LDRVVWYGGDGWAVVRVFCFNVAHTFILLWFFAMHFYHVRLAKKDKRGYNERNFFISGQLGMIIITFNSVGRTGSAALAN